VSGVLIRVLEGGCVECARWLIRCRGVEGRWRLCQRGALREGAPVVLHDASRTGEPLPQHGAAAQHGDTGGRSEPRRDRRRSAAARSKLSFDQAHSGRIRPLVGRRRTRTRPQAHTSTDEHVVLTDSGYSCCASWLVRSPDIAAQDRDSSAVNIAFAFGTLLRPNETASSHERRRADTC
jgi:hypothetical protein